MRVATRHVVWDWNGTLLADLELVVESVNHVLSHHAAGPIDADDYRNHYQRPVPRLYEGLLGRALERHEFPRLSALYHDHYHAHLHRAPLAASARTTLCALSERGHGQSLLSMWSHERLVTELERRDLTSWFAAVDGAAGAMHGTKREALERHLARVGVRPDEALVVGDALDDADAAGELGARAVLLASGTHHRRDLEARGVPVIDDLAQLVELVC